MPPFEGKPEEIKKELDTIGDKLREVGEKALAEAAKGVKLSEGNKEKIDELLSKQGEVLNAFNELKTRQDDIEQKAARLPKGQEPAKSLGEQFVDTEELKKFAKDKPRKGYARMDCKAVTTITSATAGTGAAGDLVRADRIQSPMMIPGQQRLTIRQLIAAGRTGANAIEYVQETGFQNMAAIQVNEGDAKAQSDIAFDLVSTPVVTIAHFVKASKQILDDAAMLASYIDGRLRFGLLFAEEQQLLLGSGAGGDINGIYTQATAYAAPAGGYGGGFYQDGATAVDPTALDTLRLALLQAELAFYPADGIVLNPTQWSAIETLKDASGRYIIGNPQGSATPRLWNRDVVPTQAMTTDKFLVGSFGMGAQVFDREQAGVSVSTEDGDNFTKNLVTILAEERVALAVYRPEAFIKGDLGFVA